MTACNLLDIPEDTANEPWFIEPKDKDSKSEIQRQALFLSRLRTLAPAVDALAIPNAGKSTEWERLARYREGARRGALDLVITWKFGVIFAEFKNGTSMPSKDQEERLNRYFRMGHHCGVYRKPETLIGHLRGLGAPFNEGAGS